MFFVAFVKAFTETDAWKGLICSLGRRYWTKVEVLLTLSVGFLQLIANDESPVAPLLNEHTIKVVPVSMAKDGMTLKPGFQADSRQMIVIGGPVETYSLKYITENRLISPEFFKE